MSTGSPTLSSRPDLDAHHSQRLEMLAQIPADATSNPSTPRASPTGSAGSSRRRRHPRPKLDESGSVVPDALHYVVAVSSRDPDVGLENDHDLHCLCSFPSHAEARQWLLTNRLFIAQHYIDPKLTKAELEEMTKDEDEYYIGEHCSLEILELPHFSAANRAPPSTSVLFSDHFATRTIEQEYEQEQEQGVKQRADGEGEGEVQGEQAESSKTAKDNEQGETQAAGKQPTRAGSRGKAAAAREKPAVEEPSPKRRGRSATKAK